MKRNMMLYGGLALILLVGIPLIVFAATRPYLTER